MNEIYLPSLRGIFGDWVYYSCVISAKEVAKRIAFADTLHGSKTLSELIQRELKRNRGKEIAEYIKTEEQRFFNSLVVAVYDGSPKWLPSKIDPDETIDQSNISEGALDTVGFLKLSGEEEMFTIDGQHRLAGIKKAVDDNSDLCGNDEISIVLVAHQNSTQGMIRTRRLFTTLNKKAVKVSKGEIIALDENDIMAIVARRLLEKSTLFSESRIAIKSTNNISKTDIESITTIGNLYDLLGTIFAKLINKKKIGMLKKQPRPTDKELDEYYDYALKFFNTFFTSFPELQEFFVDGKEKDAIAKYRREDGGSFLYRPLGLAIILDVISGIFSQGVSYAEAIKKLSSRNYDLNSEPFKDVFWDSKLQRIITKNKVVVRDKLLIEFDVITDKEHVKKTNEKYTNILNESD